MSTLKIKRENGKIFCPLADSWHIETPEEKVRQEYIKILVENYGYSLDQMAQEIKVNNSQRGQGKARADIVIWKSKQDKIESKAAFIVVECKAENVRIREEDYYQGYNYASWAGASFFVTTNEKETKLMENKGENWWTECVSDKIRKSADSRKAEEDKIKWHTHRGTSMINYVDFADLANIMGQNYDLFEVHIVSLEWAKQIFTTLEKSRNVIMHSGELGERDIERIGINIRDWISQVGA